MRILTIITFYYRDTYLDKTFSHPYSQHQQTYKLSLREIFIPIKILTVIKI